MQERKKLLTTTHKAMTSNLAALIYGFFADSGGGQKVEREFFHAGCACRTIVKSISAYDMAFMDAIYGRAPRYVSHEGLQFMLDHAFAILLERLAASRGERTSWLGIRFQVDPGSMPSQILLHVQLWDDWKSMVPAKVAAAGRVDKLFGYAGHASRTVGLSRYA